MNKRVILNTSKLVFFLNLSFFLYFNCFDMLILKNKKYYFKIKQQA